MHKQEEPKNISIKLSLDDKKHEIRGDDYKFISQALSRAIVPENLVVWHGVEYQENEFWDQLKDYIIQNPDGTYDYSKIVGKEIESYGFFQLLFQKKKHLNTVMELYLTMKDHGTKSKTFIYH